MPPANQTGDTGECRDPAPDEADQTSPQEAEQQGSSCGSNVFHAIPFLESAGIPLEPRLGG